MTSPSALTSTPAAPATTITMETSTSSGSAAHKIEKLIGQDNYIIWRTRMIDILVDLSFYDNVDGTTPEPTSSDAAANAKRKSTDRKALSAICLRCSDS